MTKLVWIEKEWSYPYDTRSGKDNSHNGGNLLVAANSEHHTNNSDLVEVILLTKREAKGRKR